MTIVDIHKARTHLSRLVDEAAHGKPFIIAKAGMPMVKVTALYASSGKPVRRLGFLRGEFSIPDDFNTMGRRTSKRDSISLDEVFEGP